MTVWQSTARPRRPWPKDDPPPMVWWYRPAFWLAYRRRSR